MQRHLVILAMLLLQFVRALPTIQTLEFEHTKIGSEFFPWPGGEYLLKPFAAAQSQNVPGVIRACEQFAGKTAGEKIANCIADLPNTGGTADARSMGGSQTILSTLTIDRPVRLLLGAATFVSSANPAFKCNSFGTTIEGQMASPLGNRATPTIIRTSSREADIIQVNATGCYISDVTLQSTVVRTAGAAINIKSGGNAVVERVVINKTYNGIAIVEARTSGVFRDITINDGSAPAGNWNAAIVAGGFSGSTTSTDTRFDNVIVGIASTYGSGAAVVLDSGLDSYTFRELRVIVDASTSCLTVSCGDALAIQHTGRQGVDPPRWIKCDQCFFEAGRAAYGVRLTSGKDIRFSNSYIATSLVGLYLNGTGGFPAGVSWDNGIITSIQQQSVLVNGGVGVLISNSNLSGSSQSRTNAYPSIEVGANNNTASVQIIGNNWQPVFNYVNLPDYFIKLGSGACGHTVIGNEMNSSYRGTDDISNECTGATAIGPNRSLSNYLLTSGQIRSKVPLGTPPAVFDSTTPVNNLTTRATVYNSGGGQIVNPHEVIDVGRASESGTLNINLSGAAAFSNSSSYSCSANNTSSVSEVQVIYRSGSAFTLQTRPNADVISYRCIGN